MLRRRPKISRSRMLASVPRLNPAVRWDELDTGRILAIYRKNLGLLSRLAAKVLNVPEWSQIALDDVGTTVVRQIDGIRTVRDLIGFVATEFKLSRKEAEVALLKYMEMLGKRNLVGFEVPPRPTGS